MYICISPTALSVPASRENVNKCGSVSFWNVIMFVNEFELPFNIDAVIINGDSSPILTSLRK
jgi:hypothetical protein